MSLFGVLTTGFSLKSLETILQEIEDQEKANISAGLNTTSTSIVGQLNGIFADQLEELWQVAQAVYSAQYPDTASNASLDFVVAITGIIRLAAAKSQTNLVLNLDAGITVPANSVVSSSSTGAQFITTVDVTNAGTDPANVTVASKANVTGPIIANPRSLDTIDSPVTGWDPSTAINTSNAEPYSDIVGGETLQVKIDGTLAQSVTFLAGDTTAALVATRISDALTTPSATAIDAGGFVRLESDSDDAGNSLEIFGGSAVPILGFPSSLFKGFNPSSDAAFLDSVAEPYIIGVGDVLIVEIDGGIPEVVTFIGTETTALDVARRINIELSAFGASAIVTGGTAVRLRTNNNLSGNSIQVIGGTANAVLLFSTVIVFGNDIANASTGRNAETDSELRARRVTALAVPGAGTLEAIRAGVLTVNGVTQASALENVTLVDPDANGLPAKSFEIVATGGANQDIFDKILEKKPAGIETSGTTVGTAVDSQGNNQTIRFSRPVAIDLFIAITVERISGQFPSDGVQQIKDAMKAVVTTLSIGEDVVTLGIKCAALNVTGVKNVSVFFIGTAPAPVSDPGKIIILVREESQLLDANIAVTQVDFVDL